MITDMNARVAMAQKLSIPQLQQAIKNGTVPAYVGVPLLQDKMRQQQQMQMAAAQQQQGQQQQQRPIADEVMDQAYEMNGGVDQLPSNLPTQNEEDEENYAGGGIIAFSGDRTSDVRDPDSDPKTDGIFSGLMNRRVGDTVRSLVDRFKNRNERMRNADPDSPEGRALAQYAPETADPYSSLSSPEARQYSIPISEQVSNLGEAVSRFTSGNDDNLPASARAYVDRGMFSQMPEGDRAPTAQPAPQAQPVRNEMDYSINLQDGTGRLAGDMAAPPTSNAGIANIPGATAPAQGGTAPTGAVSPATARQIRSVAVGAPATLDDAEAAASKGSPQASAAVSMLDKYVAMLEKSGDDVGRQKKEALYMALIQGGLGMMGGTSPNAFANIAQGMLPATQAYQQAIAGIRKDDRARIEKLINAGLSKEKLGMELKKLGIEEKKVNALVNYYNARAGAAGSGGSDKENRLADQFAESKGIEYDRAAQLARRNMDAALGKNEEYNRAKMILGNKNAKPADLANARKIIKEIETPYLEDISYNRSMAQRYFSRSSKSGGDAPVAGNMPKGIPQGSKQVGTSGGKPVYESPDGKRYIVE